MDAETAALLFDLARTEVAALERYHLRGALAHMHRAFDYYEEVGDTERAVAVAAHPIPPVAGQEEVPEFVRRALEMAAPDSRQAARLLSTFGWFSGVGEADYEGARAAFERSRAIAQQYGDAALERGMLERAAHVDWFHARWQDCLETSSRAIELALAASDLRTETRARLWAGRISAIRGDREEARAHSAAALAQAEKLRERFWLATARWNNAMLSILAGDWQAARELGDAEPTDTRHLGSRTLVEYQVGDLDEGHARAERLLEAMRVTAPGPVALEHAHVAAFIPLLGRIGSNEKWFDAAQEASDTVLSLPLVGPLFVLLVRIGQALMAVQRDDPAAAGEYYTALEPQRGTALVVIGMTADRLLGLLAVTQGKLDTAQAYFDDSLSFCDRAGYRPSTPDRLRLRRDAPGARQLRRPGEGGALQDEALGIAGDLDMRPLEERIRRRR